MQFSYNIATCTFELNILAYQVSNFQIQTPWFSVLYYIYFIDSRIVIEKFSLLSETDDTIMKIFFFADDYAK